LTSCTNFDGDALISVTETDDDVLLEGTFFVELVSPFSMSSSDYYRSNPLVQQDFQIALSRQVNVLASTGVQLFIISLIGISQNDEGNYQLTILTQSADYVQLGMNDAVTPIASPLDILSVETVTGNCLVASAFTCGQIFKVTVKAQCLEEVAESGKSINLSGNYRFGFTAECRDIGGSPDEACNVFMDTLEENKKVALEVDALFTEDCDMMLFNTSFDAEMAFYTDEALAVAADGSVPFVIGQDTIYGKVTVDFPDELPLNFLGVSIENVYVCTAPDGADMTVSSTDGTGGCLSSNIDADGPYIVFGNGADLQYQGSTAYDVAVNEAAFSFLTFATARETVYVHVQLLLTMTDGQQRRRMLLQSTSDVNEGNAFRSFIGSATIQEAPTTADPVETDGGSMVSVVGAVAVMIGCWCNLLVY